MKYFKDKSIDESKILHSLKGLSRHYLITEQADGTTYLSNGEPLGQNFLYEKNELGQEFLKIISD